MKKENLFEKISDLQVRFADFFQHRKKAKSLENYSVSTKFSHKNYLSLIQGCLADGFLEDVESKFLDHMLKKYQLNYLDWAHRTKWLKKIMKEMEPKKARKPAPIQTFFDFAAKEAGIKVPINMIGANKAQEARV